ncbi:MAG: YebC/PmpR family DNA-binding transcriptional regulator [Phycisphaerales bacterium]|nr:YebC/PmpR family DNA-binding transcriptional regulator [Phycisphaerales bacterium]
MAGHSKWHNIKHRKAAVDKKRGKLWSKCSRAILAAARQGGGDPDSNLTLRYAIDEARYANMPRDTIERLIKKGAGGLDAEHFESIRYEGYGPGGAAFIVEALTDNRTRTAGDVRLAFSNHGGNLGATGCVGYMFEQRGTITIPASGLDPDRVMEAAVEAGAADIEEPAGGADDDAAWLVTTAPTDFLRVKALLEGAGLPLGESRLDMVPLTRVTASGDAAGELLSLVDALEDLDDVQKVYTNFDLDDATLAAMQ